MINMSDYTSLRKYAKGLISKNSSLLEADDLINECIIRCHDRSITYEVRAFKRMMLSYLIDDRKMQGDRESKDRFIGKYAEPDAVCIKCHEVKPAACFYLRTKRSTGIQYRERCCKDCQNKRVKKWISENKAAHLKRVISWKERNPIDWKKESKDLTDRYVSVFLRKKGIPITEENIEVKRQSLRQKRTRSKTTPG